MLGMSQEQILEQLKLLLPAVGGLLTMAGFLTPAESAVLVTKIMAAAGPMMILGGMVWGLIDKTRTSLVKKVDVIAKEADSPVIGIITTNDAKGRDLANSIPGNTTVPAATIDATNLAKAA